MERDEAFRQENFDDIKSKLTALDKSIQLPPSLRGEVLALHLQGVERNIKPAIDIRWKPLALVAACFAVVCGVYFSTNSKLGSSGNLLSGAPTANDQAVPEMAQSVSEEESGMAADEGKMQMAQTPINDEPVEEPEGAPDALMAAPPSSDDVPPLQTEGVAPRTAGGSMPRAAVQSFATAEEVQDYLEQNEAAAMSQNADTIVPVEVVNVSANDGKYLYSGMSPDVDGNTKLYITTLSSKEVVNEVLLGQELTPRGVHLYREYVVVVSQTQQEDMQSVLAQIYNMKSITKPSLVGSIEQSGNYRASMSEKESLYLITSYTPQSADLNYLPQFKSVAQTAAAPLLPTQVYKTDTFYPTYTVASAVNLEKTKEYDVKAVLSPSTDIYLEGEAVLSMKTDQGQQPHPVPIQLSQNAVVIG